MFQSTFGEAPNSVPSVLEGKVRKECTMTCGQLNVTFDTKFVF